ncbi:SDR family NAD(P)-dependent oxidoreductase [Nocardia tenerifensis]|uniref:SDR family NAD(P)-dependent oxidoreductase n=1 Tax=Nocardia tenerifensis TaxID=228006 RepID=UPI000688D534|nr:SDR family NAD(P)-dependent oxidoreductase [Nocardia tenerifensis]
MLITDACSEIGRATASVLAAQGAQPLLVAQDSDDLAQACARIRSDGGVAEWHRCDISALGDVDQLVTWVLSEFGTVDVLINTAGRPTRSPVTQSLRRFRDYQQTMATNYFGPLRLTLGLLPAMLRSGSGHVINVGPRTGNTGAAANFASYASAQAAWTTFGECADAELSPHGIQVTAVHYPAFDDTEKPEQTAHRIESAIHTRAPRLEPRFTRTLYALAGVAPRSTARLMHAFGI